jgi:putative DNA primase/helicase
MAEVTELWTRQIARDGEGNIKNTDLNCTLLLTKDERYRGAFRYNALASRVELARELPEIHGLTVQSDATSLTLKGVGGPTPTPPNEGAISDQMMTYVLISLEATTKTRFDIQKARRAVELAASLYPYNPLTDYLDGLQWDKLPRLDMWLANYLKADPSHYTAAVGRRWMISAVARAYRPGCQADHVLVLEAKQGTGKSTAARILGGEYTLERMPSLRDYHRAAATLAGMWVVEIGELDAFRGAAATQVKDFLSLRHDTYRPAYGHYDRTLPRTCVFMGTTNDSHYLTDPTGGRRFWPVKTGYLQREELTRDRDQLWAEAVEAYRTGESWWVEPHETETLKIVAEMQERRRRCDAWEGLIGTYLDKQPEDSSVSTEDVMRECLAMDPGRWGRDEQTRVGQILQRFGWKRHRVQRDGLRSYRYKRGKSDED